MKKYLRERSEQVILSVLSGLSGAMFLLCIDESDFKLGARTPLNINHDNPIVKYAARAAGKNPSNPYKTFIDEYGIEVTRELEVCFEDFYTRNPVQAHNVAIHYERELTRLKTFIEVMIQIDQDRDIEVLSKWLAINPVAVASGEWR